LHPELIASGVSWKFLQHIFFNLKEEFKKYKDLQLSLNFATITLKNLISFAKKLSNQGAESFAFKNLTKEREN
jgi:hypothetical protein